MGGGEGCFGGGFEELCAERGEIDEIEDISK
jgi:hypothetical protein